MSQNNNPNLLSENTLYTTQKKKIDKMRIKELIKISKKLNNNTPIELDTFNLLTSQYSNVLKDNLDVYFNTDNGVYDMFKYDMPTSQDNDLLPQLTKQEIKTKTTEFTKNMETYNNQKEIDIGNGLKLSLDDQKEKENMKLRDSYANK